MNDNTPVNSIVKTAVAETQRILNQAVDDLLNRGYSPSGIADALRSIAREITE